ncbi:MAG: chemotaxis-specific protein-glutamate methyltransferase CheB [Lachnospiraceae bacterium]|nr:chemotaxis-specific protein-glutamate methyltransferase CheB [Lachnospiraceae bacterium]
MKSDNITKNNAINRKKILVVEDSALMRRVVCDIIEADGRYVVEDMCSDGLQAYELLLKKTYDAILVDIVMPKMTGLELLERLQKEGIGVSAVVASTLTQEGAKETMKALEFGAVDFVAKPTNFIEARGEVYAQTLIKAIESAIKADNNISLSSSRKSAPQKKDSVAVAAEAVRATLGARERVLASKPPEEKQPFVEPEKGKLRNNKHIGPTARNKLVALACSTGGPKALKSVVPYLPANLDAPVLIVQHMPKDFTAMMAEKLDAASPLHVKEAAEGDIIRKGNVYVAPGGKHMNVVQVGSEHKIKLTDEPLREGVKPCANYMYESLRSCNYDEVTCVVLTGMGADGTAGIRALAAESNIYTIAQNDATCVVYGMPKAVYEAGLVNEVVPLEHVAEAIVKNVGVK